MTPTEQRARELATALSGYQDGAVNARNTVLIAHALRETEAGTYDRAAIHWDTLAEGAWKDGEKFGVACFVAQWCRQQAQRVREGQQ